MGEYYSGSYHEIECGYQNVEIAKEFAEWVVKDVEANHPKVANGGIVRIFSFDNSSTYLAAFVKSLRPHWFLSVSEKDNDEAIFSYCPFEPVCSIFLDDYFCQGRGTRSAIKKVAKIIPSHIGKEMCFYFIDCSYNQSLEQVIREECMKVLQNELGLKKWPFKFRAAVQETEYEIKDFIYKKEPL